MAYFALADEILHGTGDFFNGDIGVDAVLIEEIDGIDAETTQGSIGNPVDVLGAAVEPDMTAGIWIDRKAEFGGDDNLTAERGEGFTHKVFIRVGPVDFGGIKEGDTLSDCGTDKADHGRTVFGWSIAKAHAHAAEPEGGDFEWTLTQIAFCGWDWHGVDL